MEFPEDVTIDILSRLPVRSLLRFKSVSKLWLSLISSTNFIRKHLNHIKNHPEKDCLSQLSNSDDLYTLDIQSLIATGMKLKFQPDKNPDSFSIICGSCDGLLLMCSFEFDHDTLFLVNPSTRESRMLPQSAFRVPLCEVFMKYGLGYDPLTGTYKVLRISRVKNKYIAILYILRTNSWKRIKCYVCYFSSDVGIYLNGALHWLGTSSLLSNERSGVISFDLVSESFSCLSFPGFEDDEIKKLGVLGDCLCGFAYPSDVLVVWVMKEYGVNDSWTKFSVRDGDYIFPIPVCSLRTGKVVMDGGEKLVVVNTENDESEEIVVRGFPTCSPLRDPREAVVYVESLISLRQFD